MYQKRSKKRKEEMRQCGRGFLKWVLVIVASSCTRMSAVASTVDAIELGLSVRDIAIDSEWRAVEDRPTFEKKRSEFRQS